MSLQTMAAVAAAKQTASALGVKIKIGGFNVLSPAGGLFGGGGSRKIPVGGLGTPSSLSEFISLTPPFVSATYSGLGGKGGFITNDISEINRLFKDLVSPQLKSLGLNDIVDELTPFTKAMFNATSPANAQIRNATALNALGRAKDIINNAVSGLGQETLNKYRKQDDLFKLGTKDTYLQKRQGIVQRAADMWWHNNPAAFHLPNTFFYDELPKFPQQIKNVQELRKGVESGTPLKPLSGQLGFGSPAQNAVSKEGRQKFVTTATPEPQVTSELGRQKFVTAKSLFHGRKKVSKTKVKPSPLTSPLQNIIKKQGREKILGNVGMKELLGGK